MASLHRKRCVVQFNLVKVEFLLKSITLTPLIFYFFYVVFVVGFSCTFRLYKVFNVKCCIDLNYCKNFFVIEGDLLIVWCLLNRENGQF